MATSNFRFLVYFKSQPQTIIVLILIFEMCRKAYEKRVPKLLRIYGWIRSTFLSVSIGPRRGISYRMLNYWPSNIHMY